MNPDGQIYEIDDPAVREKLELIDIPEDELSTVLNMDESERRAWYVERKRQLSDK